MPDEIKVLSKDTSQSGDTSASAKESTLKETPTFTQEQAEAMAQKRANDALSVAGRTAKQFEAREQAIQASEDRVTQTRQNAYQAAREAAKDAPEELSRLETEHTAQETAIKLAKAEQERDEAVAKSEADKASAATTEVRQRAEGIATKHSVSSETLIKFTDGTPEAMEELALQLPKVDPSTIKKPLKIDSGKTIGGQGFVADPKNPGATIKEGLKRINNE